MWGVISGILGILGFFDFSDKSNSIFAVTQNQFRNSDKRVYSSSVCNGSEKADFTLSNE